MALKDGMRVRAKAVEFKLWKSPERGTPGAIILFEVNKGFDDAGSRMRWTGWLTETEFTRGDGKKDSPLASTLRTLEICGWDRSKKRLSAVTVADLRNTVELVLGDEVGGDGKTRVGIRFVNRVASLAKHEALEGPELDDLDRLAERVPGGEVGPNF